MVGWSGDKVYAIVIAREVEVVVAIAIAFRASGGVDRNGGRLVGFVGVATIVDSTAIGEVYHRAVVGDKIAGEGVVAAVDGEGELTAGDEEDVVVRKVDIAIGGYAGNEGAIDRVVDNALAEEEGAGSGVVGVGAAVVDAGDASVCLLIGETEDGVARRVIWMPKAVP